MIAYILRKKKQDEKSKDKFINFDFGHGNEFYSKTPYVWWSLADIEAHFKDKEFPINNYQDNTIELVKLDDFEIIKLTDNMSDFAKYWEEKAEETEKWNDRLYEVLDKIKEMCDVY